MDVPLNLLRVLVDERHWNKWVTFCGQYDKAAAKIDRRLVGTGPSRAQLHRWLSGQLRGVPYSDHCRVLEAMFPGWTAAQLFAPCPPHLVADAQPSTAPSRGRPAGSSPDQYADLAAVFTSRAEFAASIPPGELFDRASDIRAAGLSLNMICQQYREQRLREQIENGTHLRCLFLDPRGEAMAAREREEGYTPGTLTNLTEVNIAVLTRIARRLTSEARGRLHVHVYDETIRFNIVLVDDTCVVQPYLPDARGVDSPTLLIHRLASAPGLYAIFNEVFQSLWERSTPL